MTIFQLRARCSAASIFSACMLGSISTPVVALSSVPAEMTARADIDSLDHRPFDLNKALSNATGKRHFVSNPAQFKTASSQARPGDVIIIRNGTYSNWDVRIRNHGTRTQPILYIPETPGKVIFTRNNIFRFLSNFNIIAGFTFKNLTDQRFPIQFGGASDNRFTNNAFYDCGDHNFGRLVTIGDGSHRNRFDHNLFMRSKAFSIAIGLPRDGIEHNPYSKDNRFDHNVFRDISSSLTTVRIPFQIGQFAGQHQADETRTLIDHNDFINIQANAVNSKGNNETYIANYFENIPKGTSLGLRSGNKKLIDRNRFVNVRTAIRVAGMTHVVSNNIITNASEDGISIPRWGDFGNSTRDKTGDILVAHNTILHSKSNGLEIGRPWGDANSTIAAKMPLNIHVINNTFGGTADSYIYSLGAANLSVSRNAYAPGTKLFIGAVNDSAKFIGNLDLDSDYVPRSGSVARNNASTIGGLTVDFIGAPRTSPRDIGAREAGVGYRQICVSHTVGINYIRSWCD